MGKTQLKPRLLTITCPLSIWKRAGADCYKKRRPIYINRDEWKGSRLLVWRDVSNCMVQELPALFTQ